MTALRTIKVAHVFDYAEHWDIDLPEHIEHVGTLLEEGTTLSGNSLDNEIQGNSGADFLDGFETVFG